MSEVYACELRASFYVLANSPEEAQRIAKEECQFGEIELAMPSACTPDMTVYRTRNQTNYMRSLAVNEPSGSETESRGESRND